MSLNPPDHRKVPAMNKIEALNRQREVAQEKLDRARVALEDAQRHADHLDARIKHAQSDIAVLSDSDATCSTCGADVRTEALFSAHYVIPDWRFAGLGNCPTRTR